jgi:hypothetical protein
VPQSPGPFRASCEVCDWSTIGPIWWSYHPSESSQVSVADQSEAAIPIGYGVPTIILLHGNAVGLPGNQVESSGRRRAERGAKRIVIHGEVLGIVPESGNRVAVVITHNQPGRGYR